MSDREELAALIDSIVTNDPPTPLKAADAILARWRLVPVDQHEHVWTEQPGSKAWDEHGTYWTDECTCGEELNCWQ